MLFLVKKCSFSTQKSFHVHFFVTRLIPFSMCVYSMPQCMHITYAYYAFKYAYFTSKDAYNALKYAYYASNMHIMPHNVHTMPQNVHIV